MKEFYPPWPEVPEPAVIDSPPRFVSYAQNFEDVILWRALSRVSAGFYIDVGAGDPDVESVTRAFYERGWHGINVEPARDTYLRLKARRSRDININAALLDRDGEVTFYPVDGGNGLSTIISEVALERQSHGWAVEHGATVAGDTLANICRRHAAEQPIHFLKIDVEGAERAVVLGGDFTSFRPWILVIESQGPKASATDDGDFEELILKADYRFVYLDALNRFYVASEQYERLRLAFSAPPNVYDQFVRASEVDARAGAELLTGQLADRDAAVEAALAESAELRQQLAAAEAALAESAELRQQLVAAEAALAESVELRQQLAAAEAESHQQISELQARIERATAERASFVQQLFESARNEAWLTQERSRLRSEAAEMDALRRQVLDDTARLEAFHRSRSWRLTAPFRALGRGVRRLR